MEGMKLNSSEKHSKWGFYLTATAGGEAGFPSAGAVHGTAHYVESLIDSDVLARHVSIPDQESCGGEGADAAAQ